MSQHREIYTYVAWIYILIPMVDLFAAAYSSCKILLDIAVVMFADKSTKAQERQEGSHSSFWVSSFGEKLVYRHPNVRIKFRLLRAETISHLHGIRFSDERPFVPLSTFRKFFRNKLCFLSFPLIPPFSHHWPLVCALKRACSEKY